MKSWMRWMRVVFFVVLMSQEALAEDVVISVVKGSPSVSALDILPLGQETLIISPKAIGSTNARIRIATGEAVYFAELDSASTPRLPKEILRRGRIAIFLMKPADLKAFHNHGVHSLRFVRLNTTGAARIRSVNRPMNTDLDLSKLDPSKVPWQAYLQHVKKSYNKEFLKHHLDILSGEKSFVLDGKTQLIKERGSVEGRELTRKYLAHQLKEMGFTVTEQVYATGVNLIADKPARASKAYFVLAAHFDSVGNAGADDNGTGVVSLLGAAKAFSRVNAVHGLKLVFFDEEENGLVGSLEYMKHIEQTGDLKNLAAAVNHDMIGYDSDNDGIFHILHCDENQSPLIAGMMEAAIKTAEITLVNLPACRRRSDHIRFWQYNKPAIMTIEVREQNPDENPCYHKACDRVNTINFEYLEKMAQIGTLTLMAYTQVGLR